MTKLSAGASGTPRYYALDSLRACMMLLGIWFHASCSYTTLDINWPYKDPDTSALFNIPLVLLHVFRMPIFFALAGFFARFSWQRSGTQAFLRNRATRILLPFVVGWPILFVICSLGFSYANSFSSHAASSPSWMTWDYYRSGQIFTIVRPLHLWFLYYLLYMYLFFVAIAEAVRRYLSDSVKDRVDAMFRTLVSSPVRALILAVPTAVSLFLMAGATIETNNGFLIQPKTFIAYSVFFAFGCLLYGHADLLAGFKRHAWVQVSLGIVISAVYFLSLRRLRLQPAGTPGLHLIAAVSGALITWLFLFGITGLFVRYLDRPSARIRYLADASYWMYLVHLPLMIWIPPMLRSLPLPAVVKFTMVLALSLPVLLASYEWCVRYTIIGRVLNGPRERKVSSESRIGSAAEPAPL